MPSVQPLSPRERAKPHSAAARHRRMVQKLRAKMIGQPAGAVISEATKQRLLADAGLDERFQGMTPDEVSAYLLPRIETYRQSLPFWFGHFDKPTRPAASTTPQEMPEGLRRYRDEQAREQREREQRLHERIGTLSTASA